MGEQKKRKRSWLKVVVKKQTSSKQTLWFSSYMAYMCMCLINLLHLQYNIEHQKTLLNHATIAIIQPLIILPNSEQCGPVAVPYFATLIDTFNFIYIVLH